MALEKESGEFFRRFSIPVLYTGVGKINAAYSLTRKLSEYVCAGEALPLVLNFGTAGSRSLAVGSVVACTAFVQRDMDVTALDFEVGATPFDRAPAVLEFPSTFNELPTSVCGTGDSFSTIHTHPLCEVVDMEAFSLAKVCWFFGAKFASVKYITDGADGEAGPAWQENLDGAGQRFMEIYVRLLSEGDEGR